MVSLTLLLALPLSAAAPSGAGTAGATFLKIPASAEAAALGTAWTAEAGGAGAVFANPAGLSRLASSGEAAFSHAKWLEDLTHQSAATALHSERLGGVLGFGLSRLGTDQKGYDEQDRRTGDFTTSDLSFSGGYATVFELWPERLFADARMLRLGGALKIIRQEVPGVSSTGFAADLGAQGVLLATGRGSLDLGLAALNLGPGLKLGGRVSPLPRQFRLGTAWSLPESRAALSLDLVHAVDEGFSPALGASWSPAPFFRLLAGWRSDRSEDGILNGVTFGGGLSMTRLSLTGAYSKTKDLGDSLRLEVAFSWSR